jgi:heterodisulfide reductase subunit A
MSDEKKKGDKNSEQQKVGIYICHCGGNISDHVDVEAVRDRVEKLPGVAVVRTNVFMCSDPGQELIMEDLKNGTVDRVVVASCAPSLHETTFRNAVTRVGANPYIYEHANIREQVSWVHHGEPATAKATRLISAAAAKAGLLEELEPIRVDARPYATVIGGGIAGLRVAKDLADRGIEVAVIEKTAFLGGQTARLDLLAPTGEKAADIVADLVGQVLADPAITIHTCSVVESFEGYVGNFKLGVKKQPPQFCEGKDGIKEHKPDEITSGTYVPFEGVFTDPVSTDNEDLTIDTGVIILATGFRSYVPRRGEYGYRNFKEVITLPDLIRTLAEEKTAGECLEINGRKIRSVAMIHCVGSRQIPGIHPEDELGNLNEYC